MKKFTAFLLALLVLLSSSCSAKEKADPIRTIEDSLVQQLSVYGAEKIVVYDSSELTAEILENRNGRLIVERCIGTVTNAEEGDGMMFNSPDPQFIYIGYRRVSQPLENGAVVLSYMVYNPQNNYVDDIAERYDFVLNIEWGRLGEICVSSDM